ncbi:MAG TPA: hypothetical protein VGQ58_03660 [Candidatus Limnocylindrales bacterium]|jgi:hypothetical protein|nr:hypothetical protein [Candidatus Limnocylindrales bacterium]
MRSGGLVRGWMTLAGIVLVALGLLGFLDNPLVGKASGALIPTDNTHNSVHLFTGLLALYIAFRLGGQNQVSATIGFGILYVVIFLAVLISPNLFGFFDVPGTAIIHVINAALAVVSLLVGYMARNSAPSWSE